MLPDCIMVFSEVEVEKGFSAATCDRGYRFALEPGKNWSFVASIDASQDGHHSVSRA